MAAQVDTQYRTINHLFRPKFGRNGHEFLDFESLSSDLEPTLDNFRDKGLRRESD